jgi:hypothetical protein
MDRHPRWRLAAGRRIDRHPRWRLAAARGTTGFPEEAFRIPGGGLARVGGFAGFLGEVFRA